jgi:hypothetical protein
MIKKTRQLETRKLLIEGTHQRARFQKEKGVAQPPYRPANTLQARP